jgi:hypothetical protein
MIIRIPVRTCTSSRRSRVSMSKSAEFTYDQQYKVRLLAHEKGSTKFDIHTLSSILTVLLSNGMFSKSCLPFILHASRSEDVPSNIRVSVVDVCANSTCVLCAQVCGICALTNPAFTKLYTLGGATKILPRKGTRKQDLVGRWLLCRYTVTQTKHDVRTFHSTRQDVVPHSKSPLPNMREPCNHTDTRAGPCDRHS